MKYFLDTEFIEDGKTIDLISIGIVSEDDREYYAISMEFDRSKANEWVTKNVLSYLPPPPPISKYFEEQNFEYPWKTRSNIAKEIIEFVGENPEFYGYYCDYDWVVFCQLFGKMIDLPKGFPMYCRDIKQIADDLGNPKLPDQENEHHALEDAKWNKKAFYFLKGLIVK